MTDDRRSRRQLLASLGTTAAVGVAGCALDVADDDLESGSCPTYDPVESSTTAWRGHLGPPTNTGTVASSAVPDSDLTLNWEAAIPTHVGHHVPVVADGTVYAHDMDDELSAFDSTTGETLWTAEITDPVTDPAINGDTLVVTTGTGVQAFDAATGDRRWTRSGLGGGWFDASPTVANGTIYLHRGVATYALALADGSRRWRVPTGLPSASTPAATADTVYVAGDDTYVRALSAADGSERWRTKTAARIECNLSLVGDTLVAGTAAGTVLALDAASGAERWRYQLASRTSGGSERPARPETLATDGSRVYVATDTRLVALAIADGTRCWRAGSYRGSYASGIAIADGNVYAPTNGDAHVTVFDAPSGNTIQQLTGERFANFGTGPSLADGGLYLAGGGAVVRLG